MFGGWQSSLGVLIVSNSSTFPPRVGESNPRRILNDNSSAIGALGSAKRRVYAVCVSLDELFVNAGDKRAKYHPDVGHIPGEWSRMMTLDDRLLRTTPRLKGQMRSHNSTSTSVLHS